MRSATSGGAADASEGFKTAGKGSNGAAVEEGSHLIGSRSIDGADGGVRFSSSGSMGIEPLGRCLSGSERHSVDYQEGLQRGLRMARSQGSGTRCGSPVSLKDLESREARITVETQARDQSPPPPPFLDSWWMTRVNTTPQGTPVPQGPPPLRSILEEPVVHQRVRPFQDGATPQADPLRSGASLGTRTPSHLWAGCGCIRLCRAGLSRLRGSTGLYTIHGRKKSQKIAVQYVAKFMKRATLQGL